MNRFDDYGELGLLFENLLDPLTSVPEFDLIRLAAIRSQLQSSGLALSSADELNEIKRNHHIWNYFVNAWVADGVALYAASNMLFSNVSPLKIINVARECVGDYVSSEKTGDGLFCLTMDLVTAASFTGIAMSFKAWERFMQRILQGHLIGITQDDWAIRLKILRQYQEAGYQESKMPLLIPPVTREVFLPWVKAFLQIG